MTPQRWATRGLMSTASAAKSAPHGSVQQWDARTSANDWRTALSIALGKPLATIHPVLGTGPMPEPVADNLFPDLEATA